MPPKRHGVDLDSEYVSRNSPKRARVGSSKASSRKSPAQHFKPQRKYSDHPESGVGKQFHSVPYPLSLLHKKSWEALNQGQIEGAICSRCGKSQQLTAHERKLFLVAERLSWESGIVSSAQRDQNEVNLWSVNAALDIFEPAVDDEDVVIGGKRSRADEWYPYRSRPEALSVMRIVEKAEILSAASWKLWKTMADLAVQQSEHEKATAAEDVLDLTCDVDYTSSQQRHNGVSARSPLSEVSLNSRQTMPNRSPCRETSSGTHLGTTKPISEGRNTLTRSTSCNFKTLQEFYSLLDKIERTLPTGAKFLEAYAERLHSASCKDCWFEENMIEEMDDELDPAPPLRPLGQREQLPPSLNAFADEILSEKGTDRRQAALTAAHRYSVSNQRLSDVSRLSWPARSSAERKQRAQSTAPFLPSRERYTIDVQLPAPLSEALQARGVSASWLVSELASSPATTPAFNKQMEAVALKTATPLQHRTVQAALHHFARETLERKKREEQPAGMMTQRLSTTQRLPLEQCFTNAQRSFAPATLNRPSNISSYTSPYPPPPAPRHHNAQQPAPRPPPPGFVVFTKPAWPPTPESRPR